MKLTPETAKTPSARIKLVEKYDCTGLLGDLRSDRPWAMYSYDRPAYMLWNAIAAALNRRGWSDEEIRDWLQSKEARWALDGDLGEAIRKLGETYAVKGEKLR